MQMLEAAGVPILADDVRAPDEDNPKGYYELEAVKRLTEDASFLDEAVGRAVKVVAPSSGSCRPGTRTGSSSWSGISRRCSRPRRR